MFLCDECHRCASVFCKMGTRSHGPCERCHRPCGCVDCHNPNPPPRDPNETPEERQRRHAATPKF